MIKRLLLIFSLTLLLLTPSLVFAQTEPSPEIPVPVEQDVTINQEVQASITQILSQDVDQNDVPQMTFLALGDNGTTYTVNTADSYSTGLRYGLAVGNRVILQIIDNGDGSQTAYLGDVVRTKGLFIVALIFALITLLVGRGRGFFALIGFAITLAILFWFVFPMILAGHNPVAISVLAGIVMLAINLSLAHGLTRNTAVAFASCSLGVILAWLFSAAFVAIVKLSGLADETSVFLYWQVGNIAIPQGLLLAGIILGAVGVLDDVAITQCETIAELKAADPKLGGRELFTRGMRVGRHHIASTVNTLVLAYAGASLPLLLIFMADQSVSLWRFLNTEAVAEEIVRTLGGTCALVLTVPVASLLAAWVWSHAKKSALRGFTEHEHE
ncbi:TPA: hypothetical protein DEP96_03770 [Candidatus Uhrbacteria bacterium]|nr:hypothetical protein [Candidatus Uhrbacteria bacterium]